jgi:hypothetical protein
MPVRNFFVAATVGLLIAPGADGAGEPMHFSPDLEVLELTDDDVVWVVSCWTGPLPHFSDKAWRCVRSPDERVELQLRRMLSDPAKFSVAYAVLTSRLYDGGQVQLRSWHDMRIETGADGKYVGSAGDEERARLIRRLHKDLGEPVP